MTEQSRDSLIERVFGPAEAFIYVVVGVVLAAGSLVLLVESVVTFFEHVDDGVVAATTETLNVLLLVFIFVELLGAVRVIVREGGLVAEPFLLVGIIASIKEIVVVAGSERPIDADFEFFRDAMIEIGVLAGVILVLAVSMLLLRRKEREPAEESV